MNRPIWVDQEIEKIVTNSPLNHLLVARSGIVTLDILIKTLIILGIKLNINDHIKSTEIMKDLKPYYIETLKKDKEYINNIYNYYTHVLF